MWIKERLGFWTFLSEPALAATRGPMMKTIPLLLAAAACLLSACDGDDGNEAGGNLSGAPVTRTASAAPTGPIAAGESLTGLYEKKEGGLSSQLCIVEKEQGSGRFGLNIWGGNMHACSGSGTVTRNGNQLTLAMEGDRSCSLTAAIEGNSIRLPTEIPEACNYYCGKQANMARVSLARTGTSQADALKARDVVDEPLCDTPRAE
jgi:hypothetical protein